jgi:hypothetical protein
MVDETAREITGHGGATTGRFAVRYGGYLSDFLGAATLPGGEFACQPGGDARIVRELLLGPGGASPAFMVNPDGVPTEMRALRGPRWRSSMTRSR